MQTEMSGSLAFGLDWDRDYFLRIVRLARHIYWPLSVFLLNPSVMYVLIRKSQMSMDCKAAFVAHHIVLICFDVYNGLLYQAWINCVYGTWLYLREITWTKNENR
ncbi:hypothetical protein PRIPAC_89151 [Pristionchus pacificus]|uniref:Uncharacterized protein n=1 Tax=Pristionchus pacificus TaxID=54126 RepID=A0A2A6CV32_PRIPA|nr:hypothetical protein PRIPAC_89151 [Pristionchus pacificus]|eukprot:PDM82035.1 hypothetical protein PRIPAC_36428 [Pristionchus pacificus]